MGATNGVAGYGWLSIALHWLAAAGVVAMFAIGLMAEWAGEAGDRERRAALMGVHISLGVTLFAILAVRVIAHYAQRQPAPLQQPRVLNWLAAATHHLILLAIVLLIVSGPLAVLSGGRGLNVWDIFTVPTPFAARNDAVHEAAEVVHAIGRYMLWIFVPLHVLGALKHLIFDKDHRLRMLAPE
jgi:cytochrome b561